MIYEICVAVLAFLFAYQFWKVGSNPISPKSVHLKHSDEPDKGNIDCISPSDGLLIGKREALDAKQVEKVVERARVAQAKPLSFELRIEILSTLLEWITENQDVITSLVSKDSGKTAIDANFGEILTTCEKLRWTIANGRQVLKPEYRSTGMIMAHKSARVEYVPIGVMGAIVSWNYPFHNSLGPVISAIMAGNACVVKCSEQVAYTTGFLQSLMDEILNAYSVDTNLVQFINGYAEG
jgi:acyl-CoA reductase-like NAD-dependent aldehyde dehydrogenase